MNVWELQNGFGILLIVTLYLSSQKKVIPPFRDALYLPKGLKKIDTTMKKAS